MSETMSCMNIQVIIDHAHDRVHGEDSFKVTAMPQGTRLCSQTEAIINSICSYLCIWKSIVQVEVLCGLNKASREIYELTGANLDRWSARIQRMQKVCCLQCMAVCVSLLSRTYIVPKFKYSKRIFTLNWLMQVQWLLHVKWVSYSRFFTCLLNMNIL